MRRFCLKISAVDGMDSSGKYAAVIKLMSTGTSKGNDSAALCCWHDWSCDETTDHCFKKVIKR